MTIKCFLKSLLLMTILLSLIVTSSCKGDDDLANDNLTFLGVDNEMISPSGNFIAIMKYHEEYYSYYTVEIISLIDHTFAYLLELEFRARDTNLILWADDDDVLWAYSSDVGTNVIILDNGTWRVTHYKESEYNPPSALQKARPKLFGITK